MVCKRSNSHIDDLRIGITALNPAPMLVEGITEILKGGIGSHTLADQIADLTARTAKPLTTSALTPEYRRQMVRVFTQRALTELLQN